MIIRAVLGTVCVVASLVASAQTDRRFATEQITSDQWQMYFDEVRSAPSAKVSDNLAPNQILIQPDPDTVFIFTAKSHPAYPAVVKRQLVVDPNGNVRFTRTSYFAGDKAAYEAW